jgi:hypothetical protein
MSSYDDAIKIIDNIILNNHNVCYSILRTIIENLIIIKLFRYCEEKTIDTYHFLEIWRKHNKGRPENQRVMNDLKKKYGLGFGNGGYDWAIEEIMKLDNFDKNKLINLNDIKNCLTNVYHDSSADKIYRKYNSLSKSSHANTSYKKLQIFMDESFYKNSDNKEKICNDTINVINIIIEEINKLK